MAICQGKTALQLHLDNGKLGVVFFLKKCPPSLTN